MHTLALTLVLLGFEYIPLYIIFQKHPGQGCGGFKICPGKTGIKLGELTHDGTPVYQRTPHTHPVTLMGNLL